MPILGGLFTTTVTAALPVRVVPKGTMSGASQPPAAATANVGTLTSADSLKTFGGLTAAIAIVWGGIEAMFALPHTTWPGAVLSLGVGALLLIDDLRDPNRAATPRVPWRVFAAVVNTFILFGAASTAVTAGASRPAVTPPAATASGATAPAAAPAK